jgi:hypothetical protein
MSINTGKKIVCIVDGCLSRNSDEIKFFKVPKDKRQEYIKLCTQFNYSDKTNLLICENHFDVRLSAVIILCV